MDQRELCDAQQSTRGSSSTLGFFMKYQLFEAVAEDPNGGPILKRFKKIVAEYPELSHIP
jgi:hypothetical protein